MMSKAAAAGWVARKSRVCVSLPDLFQGELQVGGVGGGCVIGGV